MSDIRQLTRADIPAVAALFTKTFRGSAKPPPGSLGDYLAEVFLDHPERDPEIVSRVHVDDGGRVTGFVGVFPARLTLEGRTLRAAIAGSLMVEDRAADPLAGARLVRALVKGPQDVALSETTNLLSQALWERAGGKAVPLYSLDWFRLLRPAGALVSLAAELASPAGLLAPFARLGDLALKPLTARKLKPEAPPPSVAVESDPDDAALAAALTELARGSALHPAWTDATLRWLLRHAAEKSRYGACHRGIVRDRKGAVAGAWIFHGDAGRTGRVLQLLARPRDAEVVVDCLFHAADALRLAALRGRVTPPLANALLKRQCFYSHRASTVYHTADPDIARAIEAGDALVTGLAAESWTRLIGHDFA